MTNQEIASIISKYGITLMEDGRLQILYPGRTKKAREAAVAKIKSVRDEIVAHLQAEADAKDKAAAEYAAKLAAIEGLDYLNNLANQWEQYNHKFNRYIHNDALGKAPVQPEKSMAEANALYPRAAAYRKALAFEYSSNGAKSSAGSRARERILNGEDYTQALNDMEAEWSAATSKHFWD